LLALNEIKYASLPLGQHRDTMVYIVGSRKFK
jgi:hypothetical protein